VMGRAENQLDRIDQRTVEVEQECRAHPRIIAECVHD
jgi:hypothetical protein